VRIGRKISDWKGDPIDPVIGMHQSKDSEQDPELLVTIVADIVKPMAVVWSLFENPFPSSKVKSTQIYTWWHHAGQYIQRTGSAVH